MPSSPPVSLSLSLSLSLFIDNAGEQPSALPSVGPSLWKRRDKKGRRDDAVPPAATLRARSLAGQGRAAA